MSRTRIQIAPATNRLPTGSLKAAEEEPTPKLEAPRVDQEPDARNSVPRLTPRAVGRPRKDPSAKARGFTITLWPDEAKALEKLMATVNENLPAAVGRSDMTRLALLGLLRKTPEEIIKGLTELRRK